MVKDKCAFGVGTRGMPGPLLLGHFPDSYYFSVDSVSALVCPWKVFCQDHSETPLMDFLVISVVQNLVELLQLPGLEEDRTFQKEISLKTLVFKAYR